MSTNDFIEKQKLLYQSLKQCYCQAIGEIVYFTSTGLNHLLYNRRRPRNIYEQTYRAALILYIIEVITNAQEALRKMDPFFESKPLWILEHRVKSKYKDRKQTIKVIIQKQGNGAVHFLSVMRKK